MRRLQKVPSKDCTPHGMMAGLPSRVRPSHKPDRPRSKPGPPAMTCQPFGETFDLASPTRRRLTRSLLYWPLYDSGVNSDISINEDETPVDCQTKATRRDYRLWPRLDEKRHSILDVPGRDYSCGGALAVLVLGRVLEGSHCLEVDSIMSLEVFS